jgi:hypothetical protein
MLHLRIRQLTAARAGKLMIVNKVEEQVLDLQGTDVYRIVTVGGIGRGSGTRHTPGGAAPTAGTGHAAHH